MINLDSTESRGRRSPPRTRRVARVLLAEAAGISALIALGPVLGAENGDWAVLALGAIGIPALVFSAVAAWGGNAEKAMLAPLLQTCVIVNYAFFGWYLGGMVARFHGNSVGLSLVFEQLAFAAVTAGAIITAYYMLNNIRAELIERSNH